MAYMDTKAMGEAPEVSALLTGDAGETRIAVPDTRTMLAFMLWQKPIRPFWRGFVNRTFQFTTTEVDISKVELDAPMAPLVIPEAEGLPVYRRKEQLQVFRPAYFQMLDNIKATDMFQVQSGYGELGSANEYTPMQRFNQALGGVLLAQRRAYDVLLEWLWCRAICDGKVTLGNQPGDRYPTKTIDFERKSDFTKTFANQWDESTSARTILRFFEGVMNEMAVAEHGAAPNMVIMGNDVYARIFNAGSMNAGEKSLWDYLDKDVRNLNDAMALHLGVGDGSYFQFRGRLNQGLAIYTYNDTYTARDGTVAHYFDQQDMLFLNRGALDAVQMHGAVADLDAGLAAVPMFTKYKREWHPSAHQVLTQGSVAPLVGRPNATFYCKNVVSAVSYGV